MKVFMTKGRAPRAHQPCLSLPTPGAPPIQPVVCNTTSGLHNHWSPAAATAGPVLRSPQPPPSQVHLWARSPACPLPVPHPREVPEGGDDAVPHSCSASGWDGDTGPGCQAPQESPLLPYCAPISPWQMCVIQVEVQILQILGKHLQLLQLPGH